MRFGTLAIGTIIGVVAYYWYTSQQTPEEGRRRFDQGLKRKQPIQDHEAHLKVSELIDEVVHEQDAPDTAVKAAFEHALEER